MIAATSHSPPEAPFFTALIEAFRAFSKDEQDSIRIQAIPMCIALSKLLPPPSPPSPPSASVTATVLPVVIAIAADRSWRVRWSMANRLHEIVQLPPALFHPEESNNSNNKSSNGNDSMTSTLSTVLEALLNDTEPEVRAAAASHLSVVCQHLNKQLIISKVVPTAQRLVFDTSEFVRAYFAMEVSQLAPMLGSEDTVQLLLPILLSLLRDDTSEVRLNVISGLNSINTVIGVELLSQSLIPAISELAKDSKWRVRLAVIEHLPMLAKQLGKNFFDERNSNSATLLNLCMEWLSDEVAQIRKAAAENIYSLSLEFGEEWTIHEIMPKIRKLKSHSKFSQRMTALHSIQVLLRPKCLSLETIKYSLLPIIIEMSSDSVPNIRFTVAKTLQTICNILVTDSNSSNLLLEVSEILLKLLSDFDRDVRFYAEKVMHFNNLILVFRI
jgi:serine/threonine-protein phosphatase 2A regulatory subunit A